MDDRYLTTDEVAAELRIATQTLHNWRSQGRDLPRAVRVGRRWLYPESGVDEFLAAAPCTDPAA